MDVQIKTKNIRLTDALETYIQRKYQKLENVNVRVIDAKLEVRSDRKKTGGDYFVAQLTISTPDNILRSEEANADLHTSIDLAIARMERQIRRFRDKQVFQRRRQQARTQSKLAEPQIPADALEHSADLDESDDAPLESLVRRKRFQLLPMDEDEAIEQMELLGHDFFVFFNLDEAQINVLYRRRDGQYGLILPELA